MKIFKRIKLTFDAGQYSSSIDKLPEYPGLYFVYRAYRTADGKWHINSEEEVPVYIGKAEDSVRSRMQEHKDDGSLDKWFEDYTNPGDRLYIRTCAISDYIADAEAACIFHIQPSANVDNKQSYNGENIHIKCDGSPLFLSERNKDFSVEKGSEKE